MEFPRKLAAARQCRVYQKQRESVLFSNTVSPLPPFLFVTCILRVSFVFVFGSSLLLFLSFFFSIFSSLSNDGLVTARSPPVKSYLVTSARNMLCEPTYSFAFTYRSGAVPRTTEEYRPTTVQTIENTPLRTSLVGGF